MEWKRKFDGEYYRATVGYRKKSDAIKNAKRLRSSNKKARVLKVGDSYYVFVRK